MSEAKPLSTYRILAWLIKGSEYPDQHLSRKRRIFVGLATFAVSPVSAAATGLINKCRTRRRISLNRGVENLF